MDVFFQMPSFVTILDFVGTFAFAISGIRLASAKRFDWFGAYVVGLECVPAKLAELISKSISIPTIGIGAGAGCDGQILVYQDMLGLFSDFTPKFVKKYANVGEMMTQAFRDYIADVQEGSFPAPEHTFAISEDVIKKLY